MPAGGERWRKTRRCPRGLRRLDQGPACCPRRRRAPGGDDGPARSCAGRDRSPTRRRLARGGRPRRAPAHSRAHKPAPRLASRRPARPGGPGRTASHRARRSAALRTRERARRTLLEHEIVAHRPRPKCIPPACRPYPQVIEDARGRRFAPSSACSPAPGTRRGWRGCCAAAGSSRG